MNVEWKEIKNNNELIQEKIEKYSIKQKVDLAKNTLLLWKKQSNVNLSSDSNLSILDEGAPSTSVTVPPTHTSSSTTNNVNINSTVKKSKEMIQPGSRSIAQQQTTQDLNEINERVASLLQLKQNGLLTTENEKQLNILLKQKKKKQINSHTFKNMLVHKNVYEKNKRKKY
jgi:hypothetical protein